MARVSVEFPRLRGDFLNASSSSSTGLKASPQSAKERKVVRSTRAAEMALTSYF